MRLICNAIGIALVAGCAAQPVQTPEPVTKYVAYDPSTAKPEAATLEDAIKYGYTIVSEDGRTMYCKESKQIGSHVKKDRVCLSEDEFAAARDANQRNFEGMKKNATIRQGLEGGKGSGRSIVTGS